VDTVPFGCYKREVFDRIGYFDEELLRNQDYEFNARLIKNGGEIYLIPDLTVTYFTRSTLGKLLRMHYQYGLYNPLVSLKVGSPIITRHIVPLLFLLFLVITGLASPFVPFSLWLLISGAGLYILADLIFSLKITMDEKRGELLLYLPWIFFLLHISYGWGYLSGIIKFIILRKRTKEIGSTR
jgi:GT2 family glycosyltransferase